jgi:hypothetical protein
LAPRLAEFCESAFSVSESGPCVVYVGGVMLQACSA